MSERNVIQSTFDEFAKASGAVKKSGSWYRRGSETIVVMNLQQSNYATRYYVNVALWLLPLGDAEAPKENKCHVRTRLNELVPKDLDEQVDALFDLDTPIDDVSRREQMLGLLGKHLHPLMDAVSSIEDLCGGSGRRLIERSLVTGPAQRLLQDHSIS